MRIGIATFGFAWAIGVPGFERTAPPMGHFDFLETAHRLNAQVVQYLDNLPLTALSETELDRLQARAATLGIALEVGMRGSRAEEVLPYLRLAQRLGTSFLRVMPDLGKPDPTVAEMVARFRPLLPEFQGAGVRLALENHESLPVQELRRVVEELGPETVGVCLDTVNSVGRMESPEYVTEVLAPYVCNLHLKDFVIRRVPQQLGFVVEGCPVGQGVLNLPDLLQKLPPDTSIVLEQWPALGPTMEETVSREAAWAQESMAYLKRIAGSD